MKTINTIILGSLLACMPAMSQSPAKVDSAVAPASENKAERPNVQIAILLDTSGSMGGLINQARTHIWKIVNDLTLAKQNGKLPNIEIALYEYGNNDPSTDYIRQVMPLTNDLDALSESLFGLNITGSEEYCGGVIKKAVHELSWNNEDKNALKMIFIAGNEPFNQGSVPPVDAIKQALSKGITVNTIYCGNPASSESAGWSDGASKGDGCFVCIDHNSTTPDPESPFDAELVELGQNINDTYVFYGTGSVRTEKSARQKFQDENALQASPASMVDRTVTKSSSVAYNNTSWDLVDAIAANQDMKLSELSQKDMLPEEFKGKSEEEMKKIIETKSEERKEIQKKISALNKKREQWLKDNKKPSEAESSVGQAIIESVRKQAVGKQFTFDSK